MYNTSPGHPTPTPTNTNVKSNDNKFWMALAAIVLGAIVILLFIFRILG